MKDHLKVLGIMSIIAFYIFLVVITDGALLGFTAVACVFAVVYLVILAWIRGEL